MQIHNKTVLPNYSRGLSVSMGIQSYVTINRARSVSLPKPYSSCVEENDLKSYNSIFTHFFAENKLQYSQVDCYNYCYQRKVVDKCKHRFKIYTHSIFLTSKSKM